MEVTEPTVLKLNLWLRLSSGPKAEDVVVAVELGNFANLLGFRVEVFGDLVCVLSNFDAFDLQSSEYHVTNLRALGKAFAPFSRNSFFPGPDHRSVESAYSAVPFGPSDSDAPTD